MPVSDETFRRRDNIDAIRHKPEYTLTLSLSESESGKTHYAFVSELVPYIKRPYIIEWAWDYRTDPQRAIDDITTFFAEAIDFQIWERVRRREESTE